MKKLILAAAIATIFATGFAHSEDAKPDTEVSYNIFVVNDYRFPGISQTRFDPAVQGGADHINNSTGLYTATWPNIKWIEDAVDSDDPGVSSKSPFEWDIYGGKRSAPRSAAMPILSNYMAGSVTARLTSNTRMR